MYKKLLNAVLLILLATVIIYKSKVKKTLKTEKVLHTELCTKPITLDPQVMPDYYSKCEATKVYEGLLEYSYLSDMPKLIPNLAEAMPEISENGIVYTFKIKQGVKFQDNQCFPNGRGREMTAEDVKYSFLRYADPKTCSQTYAITSGKIVGLDEWRQNSRDTGTSNYNDPVEGISVINKYEIQFKLRNPWPQFLHTLTMPHAFIVPKEAVEHYKGEFGNYPVGTGPFIIKKFNPQENKIIAYKNPNYRESFFPSKIFGQQKYMQEYVGKKLPFLDRIETEIILEEQPRWLNFISNKIDIVSLDKFNDLSSKISNNQIIPSLKEKGIVLQSCSDSSTSMFVFNNNVKPFNNIYVRQAMALALDRKRMNKLFNDDLKICAESLIPPSMAGCNKEFKNFYNTYNLQKAKELMIKAGYQNGNGLDVITLEVNNDTRSIQVAEFFKKSMSAIGIKIKISINSWAALSSKAHEGNFQITQMGWSADYPDAENFLLIMSHGMFKEYGSFDNPEFNKYFDEAKCMQDSPARTALYEKMNAILAENVPCLFLTHNIKRTFNHPWVKNYFLTVVNADSYYKYIDIDTELKKNYTK